MQKKNRDRLSWVNRLPAYQKLIISLAFGILLYFIFQPGKDPLIHLMIGWNGFCLLLLGLSWASFYTITSQQIREQCKKQDETAIVIFLIVLVSALASLTAIIDLFINKSPYLVVAIFGMMLSWILVHTIFTTRYAHIFYANDEEDSSTHAGGLEFPDDKHPDYRDFAYFSFVIGMTFQVSDVQVSSKRLRRLVLMHGLIAFCFNTFIVALTINLISSLMPK